MKKIIKLFIIVAGLLLPGISWSQNYISPGDVWDDNNPSEWLDPSGVENYGSYYTMDGYVQGAPGYPYLILGTNVVTFGTINFDMPQGGQVRIANNQGMQINSNLIFGSSMGLITTDRSMSNAGGVHFAGSAVATGYSSSHYIDGYVTKPVESSFTFPIGSTINYAPVTVAGQPSLSVSVAFDDASSSNWGSGVPNAGQTVSVGANGVQYNQNFSVWSDGYWEWDAGGAEAISVSVTVPSNCDKPNPTLIGYNGSEWVILGTPGDAFSVLSGRVPAGITKLGIGYNATPLPVKLISFTGRRLQDGNHLYWSTAEEINSDHFELEYSPDGRNFTKIAVVKAAGSTNIQQNYQQLHVINGTAYYRLRIVDIDGRFTYSQLIRIDDSSNGNCLTIGMVYPVPFISMLNIKVNSCKDQQATIVLIASNGAKVLSAQRVQLQKGEFVYTLQNLGGLSQGIYALRIQTADAIVIQKVLKQ